MSKNKKRIGASKSFNEKEIVFNANETARKLSKSLPYTSEQQSGVGLGLGLASSSHHDTNKLEFEEEDDVVEEECEENVGNIMQIFGSDMSKMMTAKRKRVEIFTQNVIQASSRVVVEPWNNQLDTNLELARDVYKRSMALLDQADSDIGQMKDNDEKLMQLFMQQMRSNAHNRSVMLQRVTECRKIMENYMKGVKEQSVSHRNEVKNTHQDLKKELCALQKKMMNDNQKKEMESVKVNLAKMLYMSTT